MPLMHCMTPGCTAYAVDYDVLCSDCLRQRNNTGMMSAGCFSLYDAYHADETPQQALDEDLAAVAGFLTSQALADAAQNERREAVIRRQQRKLDLRARIIHQRTTERDAERARADGLQRQIAGLQQQVRDLSADLAQVNDLAGDGPRADGLLSVDTVPGDYRPEDDGYNRLWAEIDPVTYREKRWRWFRVDNGYGG